MKISNEQIRALQEQDLLRAKTDKAGGDFSELFTRQLGESGAGAASAPSGLSAPALLNAPMPRNGLLEDSATPLPSLFEEAAGQMEGMFATLERYAGQIAGVGDDLREAFSSLEDMSAQIADFKERYPGMGTEQPALAAMLNEIDVLATTERFKFNRGDYL
ncbi:MAG: hypothetical protein LBH65_04430 [Desulfovibrio sp.]|jgi:hypothetical protein|nr:hypothetical protein [Desulfovibrio sp.]